MDAEVTGRPKHYWSIYEKMIVRGKEFDEIYDLLGLRVIVESVKDCYGALGSIHALWRPVQGRFKDYIAMPKFNLYQSLHTTVIGPGGKPVEFQIRTREMHRRGEYGVAAHWGYKEQRSPAEDMAWLQQLVDWQQETSDPAEFMASLKIDLDQDEVYVFTPKGQVVTMPSGATTVDFAYAIHTEVGHRCIGARVNGLLVPLDSTLVSGDSCEIFTSKATGAGPSRDWLQFAQTPRAKAKIRQWFSRERRSDAIETGREELVKAFRREGLPVQKLQGSAMLRDVAEQMNYGDLESLHAAIGEHHVSAKTVAQRIQRELRGGEEQLPVTATGRSRLASRRTAVGVHVEGLDDILVRLSRCCTPVPGDEIMGFVTRGRGVSVHRTDCANGTSLLTQVDRVIEVEWDHNAPQAYVVSVEVEALDRSKLLRDVADVLSEHHVNIVSCTHPDPGRPRGPPALRVRARRPRPPRLAARGGEAGRFGLRGRPRAPRPPGVAAPALQQAQVTSPRTPIVAQGERSAGVRSETEASVGTGEAGLSLLELIVAMSVFALVVLAISASIDSGLTLTRNNRQRSVAANLASQEMDTVRSAPFTTLTARTVTQVVDGSSYTTVRELTWVPKSATNGPCDGSNSSPALLRVRVTVTWPNMRGVKPVVTDTPARAARGRVQRELGPHRGARCSTRRPPAQFGDVGADHRADDADLPTNSDGCAFFAFLPSGTYTVIAERHAVSSTARASSTRARPSA